jgi:hypothetical protein
VKHRKATWSPFFMNVHVLPRLPFNGNIKDPVAR